MIEARSLTTLIQVFDMPASLAFYRDTLGFEVVRDSGGGDDSDWVMLRLGDAWLMLNTRYEKEFRPAEPEQSRVGAHDDTCFYINSPDVDAVYEFLKTRIDNLKKPTIAPYGMKQLYLRDPDGFGLCFQQPVAQ